MRIHVNGMDKNCASNTTLDTFLLTLGVTLETVIVERNSVLVPASAFASTCLEEGDVLEVIAFVGGG